MRSERFMPFTGPSVNAFLPGMFQAGKTGMRKCGPHGLCISPMRIFDQLVR